MTQELDIKMRRGDSQVVRGFLNDENNTPVNDPTAVYTLTARTGKSGTVVFIKTGTQTFVAGEGRCLITPEDTEGFTADRVLEYDLEVEETGGTVTTLLAGKLIVVRDISHA